ncbi:MAG: type II toxin-antitoxin system CcdA family antitoxin [Actinomycetota bacterium]|nr:type II toxin-antitoxin system CcdA family antitoxin [Actinomycetota bacterium]
MAKHKVSVTLSPDRLQRAQAITGNENVSDLLEEALSALIERELEQRWLAGHESAADDGDLPGEVAPDLSDIPWDAA